MSCCKGADRYYEKIEDMIGYYPSPYMKYCWKIITPTVCTVSKTTGISLLVRCECYFWKVLFSSPELATYFCVVDNNMTEFDQCVACVLVLIVLAVHPAPLSDQLHASQVQHLPVPVVGLCSWDILCANLNCLGSPVGVLHFGCDTWYTETGNIKLTCCGMCYSINVISYTCA